MLSLRGTSCVAAFELKLLGISLIKWSLTSCYFYKWNIYVNMAMFLCNCVGYPDTNEGSKSHWMCITSEWKQLTKQVCAYKIAVLFYKFLCWLNNFVTNPIARNSFESCFGKRRFINHIETHHLYLKIRIQIAPTSDNKHGKKVKRNISIFRSSATDFNPLS